MKQLKKIGRLEEKKLCEAMKKSMLQGGTLPMYAFNAPAEMLKDITCSDYYNYWKEGYLPVMLTDTSFLRNPNYHQKTDTIDTLDLDKIQELTRQLYFSILSL